MDPVVHLAQKPLKAQYKADPARAVVTDHARTCGASSTDPFRSRVEPMDGCGVVVPIGTHAAVGGPHDKSGEAVKIFVVKKDPSLTAESLIAHCREHLTGYKVPGQVEFRSELPKTNVGKILRRELRDESLKKV